MKVLIHELLYKEIKDKDNAVIVVSQSSLNKEDDGDMAVLKEVNHAIVSENHLFSFAFYDKEYIPDVIVASLTDDELKSISGYQELLKKEGNTTSVVHNSLVLQKNTDDIVDHSHFNIYPKYLGFEVFRFFDNNEDRSGQSIHLIELSEELSKKGLFDESIDLVIHTNSIDNEIENGSFEGLIISKEMTADYEGKKLQLSISNQDSYGLSL